jgi:hypothetical protein
MPTTTTAKKPTTQSRYTIQVFTHIKKYMLKKFPHQGNVFKTEEYTVLGKMVTLALTDNRAWKKKSAKKKAGEETGRTGRTLPSVAELDNFYRDRIKTDLVLELTTQQQKLSPRLFKLMRLNVDMDRVFKDALLEWIEAQGALGQAAHPSCRSFLEYYDIDPDGKEYGQELAYRNWQRTQKDSR